MVRQKGVAREDEGGACWEDAGLQEALWGRDAWVALGCSGKSGLLSSTSAGSGRFPWLQKDFSPGFTPILHSISFVYCRRCVLGPKVRS